MNVSDQQLQKWLNAKENEHLEFKEAKNHFDFEKLVKYCAALANEGGGSIILGVTDSRPAGWSAARRSTNWSAPRPG